MEALISVKPIIPFNPGAVASSLKPRGAVVFDCAPFPRVGWKADFLLATAAKPFDLCPRIHTTHTRTCPPNWIAH
jgi:hypothetical protein